MPVNGFSESTSSVMPTVNAGDSAAIGTALGTADGDSIGVHGGDRHQ